jgi:hypothetical protein
MAPATHDATTCDAANVSRSLQESKCGGGAGQRIQATKPAAPNPTMIGAQVALADDRHPLFASGPGWALTLGPVSKIRSTRVDS